MPAPKFPRETDQTILIENCKEMAEKTEKRIWDYFILKEGRIKSSICS